MRRGRRRGWWRLGVWCCLSLQNCGRTLPLEPYHSCLTLLAPVIRNCTFIENRGMGLQAHAPNSLIENCTMQRLTGPAASINPLIGWGLVSNPHNTLVRNCHAIDCSRGFVLSPGNVPVGVDCSQRMIHSVDVVGCDFGGFGDRSVVDSASSLAIGVDDARFRLSLKQVKDDTIDVISSDDARSLKAWQTAGGVLKIEFSYSARPVKTVIASVRTNTEGAKCYRLEIGFDAGWELRGIDYPIVRVETVKGLNFILGSTLGDSFADMEAKPLGWRCERLWPSQADAQFMALWTAEHGVYVGVEDAASCPKLLTGERVQRGMEVFSRAEVAATNNYVQPYDIVVRKMRKIPGGNPLTWREFADVYKAWDAQPHR